MSNFIPKVGLITSDAYLHGAGELENIGSPGKIVFVGLHYFVLEDLYHQMAFVVNEADYWVIQEGDFYEIDN